VAGVPAGVRVLLGIYPAFSFHVARNAYNDIVGTRFRKLDLNRIGLGRLLPSGEESGDSGPPATIFLTYVTHIYFTTNWTCSASRIGKCPRQQLILPSADTFEDMYYLRK
jgi:hypothetical protein